MPVVAVPHNLVIEQGTLFLEQFLYLDSDGEPISTTGFTGRLQIRTRAGGMVYATYTDTPSVPPTGVVIMGGVSGIVEVRIWPEESLAYTFSRARYDLFITPSDGEHPVRLAYGVVLNRLAVSRVG